MELRHLRYFVMVADELHFARAAERLNIAPPTLSHQIRALEATLGAQLFTRKTKAAVSLTRAGKRFLEEARLTLKQADHAERVGRRAGRGDVGTVVVGYILSAACGGVVPSAIVRFRELYPDVSFQLRKMETFPQMKAIIDGSLDVGFVRVPDRYPAGLEGVIVDRQPFWMAIPVKHRLATRKRITPDMVLDERFVAVSLEMEVGFWGNLAALAPAGTALKIVDRAPDIFSVLTLVAAGAGMTSVSEPICRIGIPGIVYRKISGITRTADVCMVYRKNEDAPAVKAFIQLLRSKASA